MRLAERTRLRVEFAPRVCEAGALGGRAEAFSEERTAVWASVLPESGKLERLDRGAASRGRLRLLTPADAKVACGDGALVRDRMYRVVSVQRWMAHLELECEEIS